MLLIAEALKIVGNLVVGLGLILLASVACYFAGYAAMFLWYWCNRLLGREGYTE